MSATKLFEVNEVLTLVSGLVLLSTYIWMKRQAPDYRLERLNSHGPLLGIVDAYRQSPRSLMEKAWITKLFRAALAVFLVTAIVSFAAGFVAALRGPARLP